jgi:hypothetical protein
MKIVTIMSQLTQARLKCPECQAIEVISVDASASKQFHQCAHCRRPYAVSKNDCCILCSYGDVLCSQMDQNLAQ